MYEVVNTSDDLSSRDYDINEIGEDDARFVDCKKEATIIQLIAFFGTIIGVSLAYFLSPTLETVSESKFIFGYPMWAMMAVFVFLTESILFIYLGLKVFKRPSLEARADNTEDKEA